MRRTRRGFTLMEMLVVLVITALLMSTLFESLGILRRAQARVDVATVRARQQDLLARWYLDSVAGLYPVERTEFRGDATHWQGLSLQPVRGGVGAPDPVAWSLDAGTPTMALRYASDAAALSFPLPPGQWRFSYVDAEGKPHATWPPALGVATALPAAIVLEDPDAKAVRWYGAVLGPLQPVPEPFEPEDEVE